MSLNPCSISRLQALARSRSTALLQPYNPLNLRTGIQYLQRPLQGEKINSYYPVHMTDQMVRYTLNLPSDWVNDTTLAHRETVERKVARGKGAPKKGFGRRAVLNSKKK
ncbi:hypothetical protein BDY24DRAFT_385477 [Mrakia frigida]|uniref:mitochondrial 37S ribosomal protein mS33 RSM27 n=1 Tax=Mrakia frigida TaxID=29902 RepID=UPI003FCBFF30